MFGGRSPDVINRIRNKIWEYLFKSGVIAFLFVVVVLQKNVIEKFEILLIFVLTFPIVFVLLLFDLWRLDRKRKKYQATPLTHNVSLERKDFEILKIYREGFFENEFDERMSWIKKEEFILRKEKLIKLRYLEWSHSEDRVFISNNGLIVLDFPDTYLLLLSSIPPEITTNLQKAYDFLKDKSYEEAVNFLSKNIVEPVLKNEFNKYYSQHTDEKALDEEKRKPFEKWTLGELISVSSERLFKNDKTLIQNLNTFNEFRKIASHDKGKNLEPVDVGLSINLVKHMLNKIYKERE